MSTYGVLFVSILGIFFIIHHSAGYPANLPMDQQGHLYIEGRGPSLMRRQDDPLVTGGDEEESTEVAPTILGRAKQGFQRFQERASDFWEGVRDQVSDWFDRDR